MAEGPFGIDAGRPPKTDGDEPEIDPGSAEFPAPPPIADEPFAGEGMSAESAAAFWEMAWYGVNAVARLRGLPEDVEDAYLADPQLLAILGPATAREVNRHDRLRRVAEKSDLALIGVTAGMHAIKETGRVAAARAAQAEALADVDGGATSPEYVIRPGGPES